MPIRDIALTIIVFGSLPFILRRPHVGVVMWVWISVMNPHRLTWDFAWQFQFAAIIAAVTLVSVAINGKERGPLPINSLTIAFFLFAAWTGMTTIFAFYPADAYLKWTEFMKTILMASLIPVVFRRKDHLRTLIWITVLSVAYYGTKGGLWVLLTGGGNRVWGPLQTYIEDNNALAVALIMLIPIMRYLQLTTDRPMVRHMLTGMMLLCAISVIGSHSRGALVAIAATLVFFCWKTKRKLQVMLVVMIAVPVVLSFMPEHWYSRMDTITNYQQDGSANMRLNSWGTMTNIANDRPIFGGGFELATRAVYARYAPDPRFPPQVAHSIYFQALGEHGYVGLMLFLWLQFMVWRNASALIRITRNRPDLAWAQNFGLMIHVSLVAFLTGGAFLSLVLYDVPYYLLMTLVAIRAVVNKELAKPAPEAAAAKPTPALARLPHGTAPNPRTS
jgi:probable O-glycosylation ligase (exosortase A-associated)